MEPGDKAIEAFLKDTETQFFKKLPREFLEIETYFQPIVKGPFFQIVGYEALSRPLSGKSILDLLRIAKAHRFLTEFDLYCHLKALLSVHREGISSNDLLFLNVHPGVLEEKLYPQDTILRLMELLKLSPQQIVLEITEYESPKDNENFLKTVFYFINQGFRISLDDFGTGCLGYRFLLEIEPDFVKMDSIFIKSSMDDDLSRKFIKHLVEICKALGSEIVAEGVEEDRIFYFLMELDIELFQGYYFYKPDPHLRRESYEAHETYSPRDLSRAAMATSFLYF